MDELEQKAREFLGPRHHNVPEKVYEDAVERVAFVMGQWKRGLVKRNGRWKKVDKVGAENLGDAV